MWVYLIPEKLLWKKSNHGSQEERLVDLSYGYAREYGSKGVCRVWAGTYPRPRTLRYTSHPNPPGLILDSNPHDITAWVRPARRVEGWILAACSIQGCLTYHMIHWRWMLDFLLLRSKGSDGGFLCSHIPYRSDTLTQRISTRCDNVFLSSPSDRRRVECIHWERRFGWQSKEHFKWKVRSPCSPQNRSADVCLREVADSVAV